MAIDEKLRSLIIEYFRLCKAHGIADEQAEAKLMDVVKAASAGNEASGPVHCTASDHIKKAD